MRGNSCSAWFHRFLNPLVTCDRCTYPLHFWLNHRSLSLLPVTAEGTGETEGYWWSPGLTYLIYAEFNSSAPPVAEHPVYGQTDQIYPYNFKQVYIKVSRENISRNAKELYLWNQALLSHTIYDSR